MEDRGFQARSQNGRDLGVCGEFRFQKIPVLIAVESLNYQGHEIDGN